MKVALFGTFDVDNYGDCLFPDIFIRALERRDSSADINCFSPTSDLSELCSIDTLNSISGDPNDNDFLNNLKAYDAVVLAGGDTIWSGTRAGTYSKLKINSMSAGMRLWAWPLMAKNQGTAGIILAPGVGALSNDSLKILKQNHKEYEYFSLRDDTSKNKISSEIKVDPDIAFNLPELFSEKELETYIDRSKLVNDDYIVFHFSATYNTEILNEIFDSVVDFAKKENKSIVLLPLCNFLGDSFLLNKLFSRCSEDFVNVVQYKAETSREMMSVLALSSGYVGTSLHGAVTAYAYGKKSIIVTSDKQTKHRGVFGVVTSSKYLFVESASQFKKHWTEYDVSLEKENALKASLLCSSVFDNVCSIISVGGSKADVKVNIGEASLNEINELSYSSKIRIFFQKRIYSSKRFLPFF